MYELGYTPERLDWNEYFVRYRDSGEIKYYNEFLHFYEPVLERKARGFIAKYELEDNRLDDLKQIFSVKLWQELQNYDFDIPLLQLIKYKVRFEWHEYVRINCGNFQPDNRNQYAMLRKIARLYFMKNNGSKAIITIISEIATEMNLTEKSVENYINAVAAFKPKYNADFYGSDDEDDNHFSAINSVADNYTTEDWFFRLQQKEKLINALSELSKTDKKLIESRYGVCLNCLGNLPRTTMSNTSMALDMTESGAEKKLKTILKKLRKAMQE